MHELNRTPSLRLQTADVFNSGYSDERSHVGMGMPSVPMKQEQVFTPVTPFQQQARYNPGFNQTPLQYNFTSDGNVQDTPLNVVTPSIVRAARLASNNQLASPFSTPGSIGGYQSQHGTPTQRFHQAIAPALFHSVPIIGNDPEANRSFAQQSTSDSVSSHPMSIDEDMRIMTGGIDLSFNNISEASMQGQENANGFENQVYTNGA
jgi:hypothetical protein